MHALAKTDPALDRPDVKIQMHNLSAEDPRHPTELVLDKFPGFGIGTFALRPESTGSVHIRSADPEEPPAIAANYLTDARDRKTSIAALRLARRIAEQPALAKLIVREVRPGPRGAVGRGAARAYRQARRDLLSPDRHLQDGQRTRWRWSITSCACTASQGLRVADASIMPTMVSSNTNAPSFLIGERCADFLLREAGANITPDVLQADAMAT